MENIPLLVTNISYGIFFIITVLFGISVYLKSSRKIAHVMFLMLSLAIGIFQISHVFGINVLNSEASRSILMGDLSVIFIVAFTIHWILAVLEKDSQKWKTLISFYAVGVAIIVFYLLNPDGFLLTSAPKMYFPNYYVAGKYYWMMLVYFVIGFIYTLYTLIKAYRIADFIHKNRLRYFISSIVIGFPLGATAFPLVLNIQMDPIYSTLFSAYTIPLAYAILRYDAMDIKIVAKKALSYAFLITFIGFVISFINWANVWIQNTYTWIPDWALPLLSSISAVSIGGFVWEKMRDIDVLKYEFITVVTHKFRTPLTRIKWASEILKKLVPVEAENESRLAINEIDNANEILVELTDILVNLRKSDDENYMYSFESTDICKVLEKAVRTMSKHLQDKKIDFKFVCKEVSLFAMMDTRRMQFALQIILENAIIYTPEGGHITIFVSENSGKIVITFTDTGIGISKDDLGRIFNKFWRSKEAKTTDTEGMGVGLFMAREIVERHDGEIAAFSEGVNKGATFTIKLPSVKE